MSASNAFPMKRGTLDPPIQTTLEYATGPIPLVPGDTVTFHMASMTPGLKVISAPASILDIDLALIEYAWQPGDTDFVDLYRVEWVINYSGGGDETVPRDGYNWVRIYDDLG